ncbi:MAG: DNA repair protein [Sterolibacteriaceae bacterium]|uniref:DNA repair protein n=1 Tax=Candidatus Methylophosphatis roskildensis TaxID=2899263 RepID=A0A9D7E6F6_9PROT|nr:DNA repair protein [Candidatus Methylophosphatis roskildensis]
MRLKGFRGIRDGLRLDEIRLDFEQLAGDASLVALAGPNGRGKTSIMDNCHPFPVMPSRAGQDGMGRFSYYAHLSLPEAEKELIWRHEGRRFRSHLVFRMNGKKKTEAFLLEWRETGWAPVSIADGTVSDGKVDTYWRCIVALLGTPETFFTSVFSAQGRRPLSAYTSSEIKTLLAELLGHAAIRERASEAAEVAKLLRTGLAAVRGTLTTLEGDMLSVRQAKQSLPAAQAATDTARRARELAQLAVLKAHERLTTLKQQAAADEGNTHQRAEIRARMNEADAAWQRAVERLNQQIEAETKRKVALDRRIAERVGKARRDRSALEARQTNLAAVLQDETRVRRAGSRYERIARVLAQRVERERIGQEQAQHARDLLADAKAAQARIQGIEREAGQASLAAEDLKRRFGLTNEVPCVGTDLQGQCKLLGDAVQARTLMPSAQRKLGELGEERSAAMAQLKRIEEETKALKDAAARYDIAESKRARTARRLQERDRLRTRLPEIERARVEWQAVHAQLAASGAVDAQPTRDELAERQAIQSSIAGIEAARLTENRKRAGETASLNRLLAQLTAPFDATLLVQASEDVEATKGALDAADRLLTQRQQAQQTVADSAGRLASVEIRIVEARGKVAHIEAQIALWSMLAKALGNDGIVALSIDDAGPTLSALANDLLLGCYGPRFTVSLKTQVETAKGECREGFSIVVHDAQSGQSKELDNMSGGEKLWLSCRARHESHYAANRVMPSLVLNLKNGTVDRRSELGITFSTPRPLNRGRRTQWNSSWSALGRWRGCMRVRWVITSTHSRRTWLRMGMHERQSAGRFGSLATSAGGCCGAAFRPATSLRLTSTRSCVVASAAEHPGGRTARPFIG